MTGTYLRSRPLLLGLFLFFYIPVAYWFGWALLPGTGIDFPSYYHAAKFAFVYGISPYGTKAFDWIPGFMGDKVQPYIYPPPSLLAFWPLTFLSLENARAAFLVVSHLCYLGSIWLMLAAMTRLPREERLREITLALSLVYLLCFDPVLATLGVGQINLIALFFICLALAALRRRSPAWRIALPLSVAILMKTYPVLLLPVLIFRRQFRAVWLTCLFFGAFTALAVFVLPDNVWISWFRDALPVGGYANDRVHAGFAFNQSINAFVMRLLSENYFSKAPLFYPLLAKPVATILALTVAGVTLFSSFRLSRLSDHKSSEDDEIAAFLLMIYLIAPISWDHHLVYILPAAVLAISLIVSGSVPGKTAAVVAVALCLIAWKLPIGSVAITSGWRTLLISGKLYPILVLWLFFINRLRRSALVSLTPTTI